MASIISASTTSATALNLSGDTTGILQLATGATPTTAVTIDASQNVGIGSTPPTTPSQYSIFLGTTGVLQPPTTTQLSEANNAYFNGTTWKARATQTGYSAVRHGAQGAGVISIHGSSSAYTAGDTLTQMDGTDLCFAFLPSGTFILNKSTGVIQNNAGRTILNQSGSVIQIINTTYSTPTTANSGTWVDTGLTATITPSSSSSKILVIVQQVGCGKDTNDTTLQLQLLRGATSIIKFETTGAWTATAARNFIGTCGTTYLDSPATASAVTYKTQQSTYSPAANGYTQYNVGGGACTSTITLMEIAG